MSDTHVLYRMFDAKDKLLYVGITCNPGRRIKEHSGQKNWWEQVAQIRIEHYSDRDTLVRAEADAIQSESPLYNKVIPSGDRRPTRRRWGRARSRFSPEAHDRDNRLKRAEAGRYFVAYWRTCPAAEISDGPEISGPVWGQIIGRTRSDRIYVRACSHVSAEEASYHVPLHEIDGWDFEPTYEGAREEFLAELDEMAVEYQESLHNLEEAA